MMRIKRKYYDSTNSYAYTVVLFSRDIHEIGSQDKKLFAISQQSEELVDVLHALLLIAKNQEQRHAEKQALRQVEADHTISGV